MRLGIITIPDFNNFGNRLQNYALHKAICKTGNMAVSFVPYKPNILKKVVKYILGIEGSGNISNRLSQLLRLIAFTNFDKKYVVTEEVGSINYPNKINEECDAFIAGSDQIWNPLWYTKYSFLDFATSAKKYAYAASFGCDKIPLDKVDEFKEYLQDFSYITVRENTGRNIIESLINRDIKVVPDPTTFLDIEEWRSVEKKPRYYKDKEKYILVYFLGEVDAERRKTIDSFSARYGYEVLDISKSVNTLINAIGPSEFLFLIDYAQFVLTDSFHACMFSIIFKKNFMVFKRIGRGNEMWNRVETLLKDYDLMKCVYSGNTTIVDWDYDKVSTLLKDKRTVAYRELTNIVNMIKANT